jgi:hypothetical protein
MNGGDIFSLCRQSVRQKGAGQASQPAEKQLENHQPVMSVCFDFAFVAK